MKFVDNVEISRFVLFNFYEILRNQYFEQDMALFEGVVLSFLSFDGNSMNL